jgi:hypothetical protein
LNNLEKVVIAILIRGEDDKVMAAEVVSVIMTIEGIPYTDEKRIKERALEIIGKVVREGLMTIGDLTKNGFIQWDIPIEDSIRKAEDRWNSLGRNPELGEVCWLQNTEKGYSIARNN